MSKPWRHLVCRWPHEVAAEETGHRQGQADEEEEQEGGDGGGPSGCGRPAPRGVGGARDHSGTARGPRPLRPLHQLHAEVSALSRRLHTG